MKAAIRALRDGRTRRELALTVLLGSGAVLAAVGLLTTAGYLISRASQHVEVLALGAAIVGVRFFGISRALLRYAERLVSHDLAFRALTDIREQLFRRVAPLVPGGLPGVGRGRLLSRFVDDVDRLQDLYLRALAPPLVALVAGATSVLVVFLILPPAAPIAAAFLLLGATAAPALTRWSARQAGRRQGAARAELSTGLVEIVAGAPELAVAGRAPDWAERNALATARVAALARRDALSRGLAGGLATALPPAAVAAVLIVAIPAVGDGALSGVMLAALVLLVLGSFEAVAPLPAAATSLDACAAAADRVETLLATEPPVVDPPVERAPGPGELRLEDVHFRYEAHGESILDGAELRLAPGRAIALLGESGTGKSTVAEIAVRFRDPTAGRVTIGGVPTTEMSGDAVREIVRLSPQGAHLFTATLRENVLIGDGDADDRDVHRALDAVGLGPWVASLPAGLDTELGEAGANVSGGQRQRIAAARMFLADARFLIFDEPASHLDPAGADDLQRRLARLARGGPGVLVVTHDRAALDAFDEVLELRGGRIAPVR